MAPHSSILAWKIPWTEEPDWLQSMASLRVGHDWATSLSLSTFMHWRRKWQPTPMFLPGESQGRGSLVGCHLQGCTELDTTEATYQQQQCVYVNLSLPIHPYYTHYLFPLGNHKLQWLLNKGEIVAFFFLSIVSVHCYFSFFCMAKWISHNYIYIPSFFGFPPHLVTAEHWEEFPVLHSRFSSAIHFIHSTVYMLTPNSQFTPPPPFAPWYPHIRSLHLCLSFCFVNTIICISHVSAIICYLLVSFWFSSLCMTVTVQPQYLLILQTKTSWRS